jgi:hypothetical protein
VEQVARYLALLALTLAIEAPLAATLAGREFRREALSACLALNLLTHPVATGLAWLVGADWLVLELGVGAVEAVGYRTLTRLGWPRAMLLSVTTNVASATTGLLLPLAT